VDVAGAGVPPLNAPVRHVDLHLHSTASDGVLPPAQVVERSAARGLVAVALTDHDTLAGVADAQAAGARLGVRVIGGCEFSVAAPWGEMHLLGYFLPAGSAELEGFLERCRTDRVRRAREMVARARGLGLPLDYDDVLREAGSAAVGRPHVARAMVRRGAAADVGAAFDRYLARGRPAFVEKTLPSFGEVAELVHRLGGLVSAAHLRDRGTAAWLGRLRDEGLDAVETRHPSHDPECRARLTDLALGLGLLRTGGSDWHGEDFPDRGHAALGAQEVPAEWLDALDARGGTA
jgi:hypothetical protein